MEDNDKLHKNQQPKKFSFVVFSFKTRGRVDKWVQGLLQLRENDCEISCPYTTTWTSNQTRHVFLENSYILEILQIGY